MEYDALLRTNRMKILEVATRHGASHVRVFGSVARGTIDEISDIDFLAIFPRNAACSIWADCFMNFIRCWRWKLT
jgi:predicted nucleotidyltransferase